MDGINIAIIDKIQKDGLADKGEEKVLQNVSHKVLHKREKSYYGYVEGLQHICDMDVRGQLEIIFQENKKNAIET